MGFKDNFADANISGSAARAVTCQSLNTETIETVENVTNPPANYRNKLPNHFCNRSTLGLAILREP